MKPMDMGASISSALRLRLESVLPVPLRPSVEEPSLGRVKNSEGNKNKMLTAKECKRVTRV